MNVSFRIIASYVLWTILAACPLAARENPEEKEDGLSEFKYDFSKEGMKNWRPEMTVSYAPLIFNETFDMTLGVMMGPKRVWGLGFANSTQYIDDSPADYSHAAIYLWHRHYYYLGPKRRTSFYTDWGVGSYYVYKVTGNQDDAEVEKKGTVDLFMRLAPGFSVSLYKNFRFFIGPYVSTDTFGLHAGFAF